MITTLDAEEVAEASVVAALRKLHFSVVPKDAKKPGAAGIEAWKGTQRIFVQVTTTISPEEPRALTPDQKESLRRQAAKAGSQPWEARVLLSPDLELVHLEWRPLE